MAKHSGAYVVASVHDQSPDQVALPWGHVDDWEGLVHRYEPDHGSVDWHYHYGQSLNEPSPPIAVPPRFRAGLGGAAGFWKQRRDKPRFKPFVPLGGF